MAYSGTTTHYGLPKYVSTDKPSWLDTNDGFDAIDQALYAAAQAVDPAQIAQMQNDITALQTGKQNVLTFDAVPTNGSVNPVTSGGVYSACVQKNNAGYIAINTKVSYKVEGNVVSVAIMPDNAATTGWVEQATLPDAIIPHSDIIVNGYSDEVYRIASNLKQALFDSPTTAPRYGNIITYLI